MKKSLTLLSLVMLTATLGMAPLTAQTTSDWSVSGTKVKLGGSNFLFKGVNYAPVPYGASTQYSNPFGSYFIPKAKVIWQRDIDLMRAMGVNSIRLYAGDNKSVDGIDLGDYQQFLDALYNGGQDPIYVFLYFWHPAGQESKDNPGFAALKANALSLLNRWKSYPAVAGMVIGNETEGDAGTWSKPAYWQGVGEIADALKAAAPNKLTLNAMIDDGGDNNTSPKVQAAFNNRQYLSNLDIIGINCYRGPDLGTKAKPWGSATSNSVFLGYSRSWTSNPKPLMITEFGVAWGTGGTSIREADSAAQKDKGADYLRENWTHIQNNFRNKDGDPSVCVGGFVFSWVDEWYKIYIDGNATPTVHNSNIGQKANSTPAFPGGQNDEEWFGIMRLDDSKVNPNSGTWDINNLKADTLIKRSTYGALQAMWKTAGRSAFTAQASSAVVSNDDGTYDTWYGTIYEDTFPWVYQKQHDWAYVEPSDNGSTWLWDQSFAQWFWTSEAVYPWMYRQSDGVWIYYVEGTDMPEVYYDSSTQEFFTHLIDIVPQS